VDGRTILPTKQKATTLAEAAAKICDDPVHKMRPVGRVTTHVGLPRADHGVVDFADVVPYENLSIIVVMLKKE
jgi:hypothetical protein